MSSDTTSEYPDDDNLSELSSIAHYNYVIVGQKPRRNRRREGNLIHKLFNREVSLLTFKQQTLTR